MKLSEMKHNDIEKLLNELFLLKGAKELFKKYNLELINIDIEKDTLNAFVEKVKTILTEGKHLKEYKQAIMFLDTQISVNTETFKTTEGFMKTMIEGIITGFENSKKTVEDNYRSIIIKEILDSLDLINTEDKNKASEYINKLDLQKIDDTIELIKSIELNINQRYLNKNAESENKKHKKTEVKSIEKNTNEKETLKEEKDNFEGLEKLDLNLDYVTENKDTNKNVEKLDSSNISDLDMDNDLDDLDDLIDNISEDDIKEENIEPQIDTIKKAETNENDIDDLMGELNDLDLDALDDVNFL